MKSVALKTRYLTYEISEDGKNVSFLSGGEDRVIDRYFGNLCIDIAYKTPELCVFKAAKTAEDFFNEYQGEFVAKAK